MKTGHGGKRRGAGKPQGIKWPTTLERQIQRKAYQQAVMARLQPLVHTQVDQALGRLATVAVVEMTDNGLSLRKVTDEKELAELLQGGAHRIQLVPPNVEMSKYVTDQAIGKVETQSLTVTTEGGKTIVKHEHLSE